jgi:hypothetical protein
MSQSGDDEYSRRVAGESRQAPPEADELRRLVPVIALGAAVFAAVTDPLWTAELALAAIPVARRVRFANSGCLVFVDQSAE